MGEGGQPSVRTWRQPAETPTSGLALALAPPGGREGPLLFHLLLLLLLGLSLAVLLLLLLPGPGLQVAFRVLQEGGVSREEHGVVGRGVSGAASPGALPAPSLYPHLVDPPSPVLTVASDSDSLS